MRSYPPLDTGDFDLFSYFGVSRVTKNEKLVMRQVIIFADEAGNGYVVECPSLPGCISQGDSWDEAVANIKEAIELWIEDAQEYGELIPPNSRLQIVDIDVG